MISRACASNPLARASRGEGAGQGSGVATTPSTPSPSEALSCPSRRLSRGGGLTQRPVPACSPLTPFIYQELTAATAIMNAKTTNDPHLITINATTPGRPDRTHSIAQHTTQ